MPRFECRTCGEMRLVSFLRAGFEDQPLDPRCPARFEEQCRWRHFPDFGVWNGKPRGDGLRTAVGSQNFAELAEPSVGNYRFHAELARLEMREGLGSRELLSRLYWPGNLVGRMVSLELARRADDTPARRQIRTALRAMWTLLALIAQPTPLRRLEQHIGPQPGEVLRNHQGRELNNARYYQGVEVYTAGERFNAACLLDGPLGMLLSCALAWPGRRFGRSFPEPDTGNLQSVLLVVRELAGADPFRTAVPSRVFGLTQGEREQLTRVVEGDGAAARDAFEGWLKDWPIWQQYRVYIRRTTRGTEVIFPHTSNGNKPAAAYASLTPEGEARILIPAPFRGTAANRGWQVHHTLDRVSGRADGGVPHEVPRLGGDPVWRVHLRGTSDHEFFTGD